MKNMKNFVLAGILVLMGACSMTTLAASPVAASPVIAYAIGEGCTLPDGNPGVSTDGYTCCPPNTQDSASGAQNSTSCFFAKYINPLIALLSAMVGIAVVISIIWGGIEYITSEGDPQKAANGKKRIVGALVGLVAFILLFTLLQFLSPGGVLNG